LDENLLTNQKEKPTKNPKENVIDQLEKPTQTQNPQKKG
jgi:hypothetical protein